MRALRYLVAAFSIMLQPPQILPASQLKPVQPCSIAAAAAYDLKEVTIRFAS